VLTGLAAGRTLVVKEEPTRPFRSFTGRRGHERSAALGAAEDASGEFPVPTPGRGAALVVLDGRACPGCIEVLGRIETADNDGRFPTIEEYRRLEAEWRTPVYSSMEEASAAWEREHSRESCA
jgi:hypothetical protein